MLVKYYGQYNMANVHTDNQCCYQYGSVPRNESNCVVEGRQLSLNCIVNNPHDNFTNLTVRWFRNFSRILVDDNQNEYTLDAQFEKTPVTNITNGSCRYGPLYRDKFILVINNFTSDKNGYYLCQIIVNNSISQPSK